MYLHFNRKCPDTHSVIIGGIGTAQILLSLKIVVGLEAAAGYSIIAYIILTVIAFGVAFRGWHKVVTDEEAILVPEEIKLQ